MLETNKIHLGDCLELMPAIPSKSIDMILCDLPYGTTSCEWDSIIDMGKLWPEYERVIKDNGAIVLTANSIFTFRLWASNTQIFKYKWVWAKSKKTSFLNANRRPLSQHEDILIFYKSQPKYIPQKSKKEYVPSKKIKHRAGNRYEGYSQHKDYLYIESDSYYPSDILYVSSEGHTDHPTQKPVALFEYLIKTYTNEGETVLDNCSGSGTTAIACLNSNRQYICIEKDEAYYKKSLERIANHEPLLHLGDK